MNHLNSLITNPTFIKQFADYYINVKSEVDNQRRWERFIEVGLTGERKYRIKMRQLFDEQLDDIIKNLNTKSIKADESIGYVDENRLADWNGYRIQYNEFGQLTLPGIMSAWADLELEALEVGISFDVVLPDVLTAITNRSNLFSDSVINETRASLHQVITDSINAGDGIPQLEKKIRALYANMSKARAIRIARTEMIWAQNEGAERSYIQSGVVESKQWIPAHDERLCPWCSEMGQKDPLKLGEQYFRQGESMTIETDGKRITMTFNYEPILHPPLHPHCRCCLIPIVFNLADITRQRYYVNINLKKVTQS